MASELTPDDVGKMKVAELRAELKARDLSTTGLKKELADRLLEHLQSSSGGVASNGTDEAQAPQTEAAAAEPDAGTDVPEIAAPSGDSTAQTAGEAAPILTSTEQADTLDLPSEMPVVPPATEDSVDDFTGAEGTIAQETATEGVEKSNEPSAVHRPPPDHLDKIPGFVADSRLEEAREKAEVVPLNESAVLSTDEEATRKRKHDEVVDPVISAPETAVPSVAEQAETSEAPNDEIKADPAASSILNGSEPETKRARVDEGDIPVPQTAEAIMGVDSTKTNGASSSTFPTSVVPPGGSSEQTAGGLNGAGPEVVPLNEAQKPATDFAIADAGEATAVDAFAKTAVGAAGAEEETKSVPTLFHDTRASSSFSSSYPLSVPPATLDSNTHYDNPTGSNNEKRDNSAKGEISTTIPSSSSTQSLKIRGLSSNTPSNTISQNTDYRNQIQNSVATNPSITSKPVSNSKITDTLNQLQKPPLSNSICISNLVRPFTLPSLKSKLEHFGELDYFWINSIKSHCFVTFPSTDSAENARSQIEGEIWPEAVGKPLSVTYIPSEKIASLVEKEEAAGRTRLELVTTFDETSSEWQYDVIAPSSSTGKILGHAPPVPRGSASSMPLQARAGLSAPGPFGRLDPRNMITATSASGASIQLPSNSAFAQSKPPTSTRQTGPASSAPLLPPSTARESSDRIWTPRADAEDLYNKTSTTPQLYYKAVDKVAAGRRLRQLEVGPRTFERGPYKRASGVGRPAPSTSYRDSYRP